MEVIVPLELEDPKKFEHVPHADLKEGRTLEIARALKNILHKLLETHLNEDADIHIGMTVDVPPPSDWRQKVNNTQVNMVSVRIIEDSFVVWVDEEKYPWGDSIHPYIFLASLRPNKMSKLKTSGFDKIILERLRLTARQQLDPTATSSTVVEDSASSPEEPYDESEEEPCDESEEESCDESEEESCDESEEEPCDEPEDLDDLAKKLKKLLTESDGEATFGQSLDTPSKT